MSNRSEEAALKAYPYGPSINSIHEEIDKEATDMDREAFIQGYEQAEKDMIERVCEWLYKYNQSQAHKYGARAELGVLEFTIDVDSFRNAMEKKNDTE